MLSDWLKLMLEEIARKQAERDGARAEQQQRELERTAPVRQGQQADEHAPAPRS